MANNTEVVEMLPSEPQQAVSKDGPGALQDDPSDGIRLCELPGPGSITVVEARRRWNSPRINTWRLAAVYFSFIVFGMNDGVYGAIVPYLEKDYDLSYTVTSLIFLSPFVGYTFAAFFSDRLHVLTGRRGISYVNTACRLIAYVFICVHPPYPVVVVILAFAGFGNGLLDAAWNAWIGQMDLANELLGFMHGCYGLGAAIAPLIATTLIIKTGVGWWYFYYIMVGLVTVELFWSTATFWSDTGKDYRDRAQEEDGEMTGKTRRALKQKTTWILSAFFLFYVGIEVSTGGWIVTFMINVRHGQPFSSGMTATGFWLGITFGRITLGFLTPKIGERLAVIIYTLCALGLELVFWLVPQIIVSAVAISLLGFFIGPLFPTGVIMATKLLPPDLHVAAIGFSAAFGGIGAAV